MAAAKKKTARGRKQDRARVGRRAGLRSAVRGEEDRKGGGGEKGRQEGRQRAQARRETTRPLRPGGPGWRRCLAPALLVRGASWAGIADRVQHVANLGRRFISGDACWRVSTSDIEGPLPRMRIGAFLHPTVLLALADGASFLEHVNRPSAHRPYRRPALTCHQHGNGS